MRIYLSIMEKVNRILKFILIFLLFASLVILSLEVLSRFILNIPLRWTAELARYFMIWMTFIGAAVAIRYGRLIKLEIITIKMPQVPLKIIRIIAGIIALSFYIILIIYGVNVLEKVESQHSPALQISMAIQYSAIPIGAFFMIFNTIASILDPSEGGGMEL